MMFKNHIYLNIIYCVDNILILINIVLPNEMHFVNNEISSIHNFLYPKLSFLSQFDCKDTVSCHCTIKYLKVFESCFIVIKTIPPALTQADVSYYEQMSPA